MASLFGGFALASATAFALLMPMAAEAQIAAPTDNGAFETLYRFDGSDFIGGVEPAKGLVLGQDGALYGTTRRGGAGDGGTLFRVTTDGALEVLRNFQMYMDGSGPYRPILSADGRLYGATGGGGSGGSGTVYRVNLDGTDFEVLHSFDFGDQFALGDPDHLVQRSDGKIFGLSWANGYLARALFSLSPDGTFQVAHVFADDGSDGWNPDTLVVGADGGIWGATLEGGKGHGGTAWHLAADGSFHVVHRFSAVEGSNPSLWLANPDGSFYGTTSMGGPFGGGTIFRMSAAGGMKTIYGFGGHLFEGSGPSGLWREPDGTFYGITESGGRKGGLGTIYRLSPDGKLKTLHDFGARFADGIEPFSDGLAKGNDGAFYGSCAEGGILDGPIYPHGMGTLFRMMP